MIWDRERDFWFSYNIMEQGIGPGCMNIAIPLDRTLGGLFHGAVVNSLILTSLTQL